jgi:FkbM family methyltransferase
MHAVLEAKTQQGRSTLTVARAAFERRHYRALRNILLHHTAPADFIRRYLFKSGSYPCLQIIRQNGQELRLLAYSWHDILTINEVFFRCDYVVSGEERTIVDFGSNIGVSAAYFLTASPRSFCYLFEPLPQNVARLRHNLSRFELRYELAMAAVALSEGEREFGYEETGRYGGIGIETGAYLTVSCVDAIGFLSRVVEKHGSIDVLKIDIEALEKEILVAIPARVLRRITRIFVEQTFAVNPLAATHVYRQYGSVAQFFLVPDLSEAHTAHTDNYGS